MTKEIDAYTPKLTFPSANGNPSYWTILIETRPCECCGAPTVAHLRHGPFPAYHLIQFATQCKRAGLHLVSHYVGYSKPVCVECKVADKATIECKLCRQTRPASASHESFGDPAEHLCTFCWETVPAKRWAEEVKRLEEEHRYDFE